ncbi:hypothetical protein M885DRAFT_433926, partial [Pelagophyceae sp. CCMP2097]
DVYLTHDSAPGRKQHIRGWKHRENVKMYYESYMKKFYEGSNMGMGGMGGMGMAMLGGRAPMMQLMQQQQHMMPNRMM